MARYPRSNLLALAVLVCLLERPMHPYEMATVMRHRGKEQSIKLNYGSLYTVVSALSRAGLIEAQETKKEGRRPERTVYRLLPTGHTELIDWLSDMLGVPAKEYPHFEAALSMLPALPPEDVEELLDERCSRLELLLLQHQATRDAMEKQGFPELFSLESDFSATLQRAELEWVRQLRSRIVSGELGGLEGWRQFLAEQGDGQLT